MTDQEICEKWLTGSPCHAKGERSVMLSNSTHIVLKHHRHGQCRAVAYLYDRRLLEHRLQNGAYHWQAVKPIYTFRHPYMQLARVKAECRLFLVNFDG